MMAQMKAGLHGPRHGRRHRHQASRCRTLRHGQRQAAMMAYIDVFFLLAIMFAACLPLILMMKKAPKGGGGPGAMAH